MLFMFVVSILFMIVICGRYVEEMLSEGFVGGGEDRVSYFMG